MPEPRDDSPVARREFLKQTVATAGVFGAAVATDGPVGAASGAPGRWRRTA